MAASIRAAPDMTMTGNTMILLFSHRTSVIKPSQTMRAAVREPARGEILVELIRRQPFDDFP